MEQGGRLADRPADRRGARRAAAGGVVGAVMVGTALLGGGTASALDCNPLPLVGTALYQQCKALGATAGGATSAAKAVPRTAASAAAAVPRAVPRVVPQVVPKARPATGAASGAVGALSGSGSSSSGSSAGASSRSAPAAAPAGAPASAAAPAPALAPAAPVAAASGFTTAFDALPASFLGSAVPGAFPAFGGVGVAGAYDPGLLLTSSAPVRALAPSRVTTGSSAVPLSFLGEDGRIQTPVLLSVLSVAVVAALGVRAAVLRRARRRRPAPPA